MTDKCINFFCFVNLEPSAPKFFGFSEFLAGLALMVLAWTIADTRYRFRIRTSPIPLEKITFGVISLVGSLTLLTDLWRAQGWPVLKGGFISPAGWQAFLAAIFFVTFLAWIWFAFLKPSVFSRFTSERYVQALYDYILRGDYVELAIIADELARSSPNLVKFSSNVGGSVYEEQDASPPVKLKQVEFCANEIFYLICDKRFCKAVIERSPLFALELFSEIGISKKYEIGIDVFARNIFTEALLNTDSFLYHESDYYESGLIGQVKPLSTVIFKNYELIKNISMIFDVDYRILNALSITQFDAYCAAFLHTVTAYINEGKSEHSVVINTTLKNITQGVSNLHKVNGMPNSWESDPVQRLDVCVRRFGQIIYELNKLERPLNHVLRNDSIGKVRYKNYSIYDAMADNMFEVLHYSSYVNSPVWDCWSIQHNTVLAGFFEDYVLEGKSGDIIKHKLRRIIYNEIVSMEKFPNFKGARVLSFVLNVLGLNLQVGKGNRSTKALHKCILSWVTQNYALLYQRNPEVALSCLVEPMNYDEKSNEITKIYPANVFRKEAAIVKLTINPAP